VLGYHESAPAALVLAALFHRCNNELSFITASLAPRPGGKKEKPLPPLSFNLSGGSEMT
jgi:hypothetical protein